MIDKSIHFEQLWEQCEQLHAENSSNDVIATILDELSLKINLYKMIQDTGLSDDEHKKAKSRTLGEILLTLTHLSLKEDINVFEALAIAKQQRRAENYQKIPQELRLPIK
jgi:hypothetical protein